MKTYYLKKNLPSTIKLMCIVSTIPLLASCTGLNSLYPKFKNYHGADSAVLYVKDDGYNYSIYTFTLTNEGCYEKKERRLLTRNLFVKGSDSHAFEYTIKAGENYVIGYQEPGKFVYRSFIPESGVRYALLSNALVKLIDKQGVNDVTIEKINDHHKKPALIHGWNIKNICPDIFGYRHVD